MDRVRRGSDHADGHDRTLGGTVAAGYALLLVGQIGVPVRVLARGAGEGQAAPRTGVDADTAGHACLVVDLRLGPFRAFHGLAGIPDAVQNAALGADAAAGPAIDAQFRIDGVGLFLFTTDGAGRADAHTGAAAGAAFGYRIRHMSLLKIECPDA